MEKRKKKESEIINCFRRALGAEIEDGIKSTGRSFRGTLIKKIGISRAYLSDIENMRKVGTEDIRHEIASAVGYEYSDFIQLGRLLSSMNLEEARREIERMCLLRPNTDGYIEQLLPIWKDFSDDEKDRIVFLAREIRYDRWEEEFELTNLPEDKNERFLTIWKKVCSQAGIEFNLDEKASNFLFKYNSAKKTPIMIIIEEAKAYVERRKARD